MGSWAINGERGPPGEGAVSRKVPLLSTCRAPPPSPAGIQGGVGAGSRVGWGRGPGWGGAGSRVGWGLGPGWGWGWIQRE